MNLKNLRKHLERAAACDLSLVSISLGMEGLVAPSKFYGSLAAARPIAIICEPDSYLRQIVTEANCGAAFNHGDGEGLANFIRRLATDARLADEMGHSGRQYLEANFTLDIVARQYDQVLRRSAQLEPSHAANPIKHQKKGNPVKSSG